MGHDYIQQHHDDLLWFLAAAVVMVWFFYALLRYLTTGALPFESDEHAEDRRRRHRQSYSYWD